MPSMRTRKKVREWRGPALLRLRKKMRQLAALQRVMDVTEKLGLYDLELEELDAALTAKVLDRLKRLDEAIDIDIDDLEGDLQ
jgi:hypothetical protein